MLYSAWHTSALSQAIRSCSPTLSKSPHFLPFSQPHKPRSPFATPRHISPRSSGLKSRAYLHLYLDGQVLVCGLEDVVLVLKLTQEQLELFAGHVFEMGLLLKWYFMDIMHKIIRKHEIKDQSE